MDYRGRRKTGEAYVQFEEPEMANQALLKHREEIGNRWVNQILVVLKYPANKMSGNLLSNASPQSHFPEHTKIVFSELWIVFVVFCFVFGEGEQAREHWAGKRGKQLLASKESEYGLHPRIRGPWPEWKVDASRTEPPRCPESSFRIVKHHNTQEILKSLQWSWLKL